MIVYENTKKGFFNDVRDNVIADRIEEAFKKQNFNHNNEAEYRAFQNSLNFVRNALDDDEIGEDCKLAIEYQIPLTSKRVDFLIAGKDESNHNNVVIIELKQWEDCKTTLREDVVLAYTGGAERAVAHPCYQAYSYAKIMEEFNESVVKENINLYPCAYLHNFRECNRKHIDNEYYKNAIELAPLYLQNDTVKLRNFVKQYIRKQDNIDLLLKLENGKLKPAKSLQDALKNMLRGNKEFYLIDEQKVVYETVRKQVNNLVRQTNNAGNYHRKAVVICQGGPGTGKSVVAIQLLCDLINCGYSANYVTKNAAPRNVFFDRLRQDKYKLNYIKSLFKSSDSFWNAPSDMLNCIIVDEAHRLKRKSQIFHGENQVKELINAAQVAVFFIDENQKVTTKDIGTVDEIKKWAEFYNCELYEGEQFNLVSQFRCNGSDGYLAFLDNLLQIKETANYTFDNDYEIKLFANPIKMREELREKNNINNKSRMIAGYCYEWNSEKNPNGDVYDIILENGFEAKWNFSNTSTWAIDKDSFEQVGCIHTSQGLEFDYCGVIIGQDLRFENDCVITDQSKEAKSDKTSGIRTCKDKALADKLIRNTYKTLLSRGQKGCFIYCENKPLLEYIGKNLGIDIIK